MDKILAVLQAAGIPFAYDHFAEGEAVDPPFICYLLPGSDNFAADGKVYHKISRVNIELYTDKKDLNAEQKVRMPWTQPPFFMRNLSYGSTVRSCTRSFTRWRFRGWPIRKTK